MLWFTKNKSVLIVILVALLAVCDLANYGIPPTHDGEYHVMRFQQFAKTLSEGVIYPRWAPDFNNGFGIPLFNYVYPLPNFMASLFHFLGFGFIDSLKLNMVAATIVGAIFMYLWSRKYWGDWGGVVSSVFYTFSPYHFLDIYVRGSVGEVWSLGLAPGLFWSYYSFFETKQKKFLVFSSVFLALLILAHNILALIFFGFFILYTSYLIINTKKRRILILDTVLILATGLGIASPFWLPAIIETKFVTGLQIFDPTEHFPVLHKLIYSSWGYGFSGGNSPDQMSLQVGIANIIAILCSTVVFLRAKNKTILYFLVLFALTTFLITPYSAIFWDNIPGFSYIQFPWRLLSLAILLASFVAGSLADDKLFKKNRQKQVLFSFVLIILSIGFSLRYAKAPFYHERADSHYLTRSNFTDGTNSPGDLFNTVWFSKVPDKREEKFGTVGSSIKIKTNQLASTSYDFETFSSQSSTMLINTAYFPGWTAEVNGKLVGVKENEGKMQLYVPAGSNRVRVFLDSTPVQKASYVVFLVSVVCLALIKKEEVRS